MRIPVIPFDMPQHALGAWARLLSLPQASVQLHPSFIGYRGRDDAWSNQAWLPHERHHIFFLVDEGYCDMGFESQQRRFGPGACFLLHPETGPSIAFSQKIRFHEVYIKILHKGIEQDLDQACMCIDQAWDLGPSVDALSVYRQQDSDSHLLRYSIAQLLLRFEALFQEQNATTHALSTAQCNKIIRWTRDHIEHSPEPRDIAQILGLTPDYCSRVFKQRFSMSLRDWLIRERIQEAARRLRERSDRVEEIGLSLGFGNPAHFSRQFKRHMHCTPSYWRRS